jgi:hydroxymethylbilane synthase
VRPIVIGSRGSQLALWQAEWTRARLAGAGIESRIEIIKTTGDIITGVALSNIGTKGLFTKELEEALLARTIDLAVHSLKDMPTDLPDGLTLGATPVREDARDAICGRALRDLGPGARVGTSSLRRSAQLKALRPDLMIESVRGNLDTRLRKLDEGQFDAIVLASAGLRRLGWQHRITEALAVDVMCPAVGQGALAIEIREGDSEMESVCTALEDAPTRIAVTAERALLAALGGGCQVPIGAHARLDGEILRMRAIVAAPDGSRVVTRTGESAPAGSAALGERLADELMQEGAAALLAHA